MQGFWACSLGGHLVARLSPHMGHRVTISKMMHWMSFLLGDISDQTLGTALAFPLSRLQYRARIRPHQTARIHAVGRALPILQVLQSEDGRAVAAFLALGGSVTCGPRNRQSWAPELSTQERHG